MKNENIYTKSLELLDQFLNETSEAELAELISRYDQKDIKGPTFDEYLRILQYELERNDWNSCSGGSVFTRGDKLPTYLVSYNQDIYPPPPSERNKKSSKKDSAIFAESFF